MKSYRSGNEKFDKGDLKDELKASGFEKDVADNIADRVNEKKADNWTQRLAREQADREIEMFIENTQRALENFRRDVEMKSSQVTAPMT